jgi:hypothetical protein
LLTRTRVVITLFKGSGFIGDFLLQYRGVILRIGSLYLSNELVGKTILKGVVQCRVLMIESFRELEREGVGVHRVHLSPAMFIFPHWKTLLRQNDKYRFVSFVYEMTTVHVHVFIKFSVQVYHTVSHRHKCSQVDDVSIGVLVPKTVYYMLSRLLC